MASSSTSKIDAVGFRKDLDALRARTLAALSPKDFAHLKRMEWAGRILTIVGFACAWIEVNPLSIVCIALGITARWMVMHHVGHGGYDKVPGVPARYTRKHFAMGARRWLDWFDWIEPTSWNYEHNHLHHYHTSEPADPDLVDRNVVRMRESKAPRFVKYLVLSFAALTWKFTYYAPNALNGLETKGKLPKGAPHQTYIEPKNFWDLRRPIVRRMWLTCVAPYLTFQFFIVPALFLPLGTHAAVAVLINRILAELLSNLQTFLIIVPSHAAEDLMAFEGPLKSKEDFYLRQALSTANYRTGGDLNDFLHMWINYQLEHHLFPDLPMSKYQEIQPEVKAIFQKHGVPYVQESIFKRIGKLLDVCTGAANVPRWVDATHHIEEAAPAE